MTPRSKLRRDVNETAFDTTQAATGRGQKPQPPGKRTSKHPEAVARGRKGGQKGGKARAKLLTADEVIRIAKQGAAKRWKKPTV